MNGSKMDGSSSAMTACLMVVLCSNCETTKNLKKQLAEMENKEASV